MNQLQQQILYTNNGETEQESRIAKAKLRKELLEQMCFWAENSFLLNNNSKENHDTTEIYIIGRLPKPFKPSIFEKKEFRDIIKLTLDTIYEENRSSQATTKTIALNLLGRFYGQ
ncbi:hypothetical protein HOE04_03985 [archaeon]|jgi:hypothetical protein|nr:hypothetical protein [archaeon]